jgi:hypothetical protein
MNVGIHLNGSGFPRLPLGINLAWHNNNQIQLQGQALQAIADIADLQVSVTPENIRADPLQVIHHDYLCSFSRLELTQLRRD